MNATLPSQARTASAADKRALLARRLGAATRSRRFPLSFAQERLWFVDQLHPNSIVYNLPGGLRITGPLRVDVLESVINEVLRRHEILRTTYSRSADGPGQNIHEHQWQPLPVVDLEGLEPRWRLTETRRLSLEESARPFDLSRGPVVRVLLLRHDPRNHAVLYTLHHIASDGWSQGVLNRELGLLYAAFLEGKPSPLPELPIQYVDYAAWQRDWFQGDVLEQQLAYWRNHLAGVTPLELPTDHPRPTMITFAGARDEFKIDADLTARLRALAQQEGTTLFMVLLAAYQLLLSRYSGRENVAIGVPIANRNRAEIENLIGCFVNTLMLRTDLSGDPSWAELFRRVKAVSLEAYAHQDLPFERLVEELQPDRDLGRNPLVQVELEFENTPDEGVNLPGIALEPMEATDVNTALDLELHIQQRGRVLTAQVIYSKDLFESATIRRMISHLLRILESIARDTRQPLSETDLLSDVEREHVLVHWTATRQTPPSPRCLHQLFEDQVARSPDAIAVVSGDVQLCYRELDARADLMAERLNELGVGPEILVGLAMEPSLDLVVAMLGILKAGGAYVPLDPSYPTERLAFMLNDAGVSVLLTQRKMEERLPVHGAIVECVDALELGARRATVRAPNPVQPDNLAYMIYTSGSSGLPKGVLVSHRSVVNATLARLGYYETPIGALLVLLSFSFDASIGATFGTLCRGGTLVLAAPEDLRDPGRILDLILQHHVSHVFCLASVYEALLSRKNAPILASLRVCITGGELCSPKLQFDHHQLLGSTELFNEYGPTEATVWSTARKVAPSTAASHRAIGRPISNVQVCVLDRSMKPVPPGITGELFIGGEGLARAYHNWPDLTAERFVPHPFGRPGARLYRTGDLARFLPEGELQFLGRRDQQVKIRGYRVELAEIEIALKDHADVENGAVVAHDSAHGDKQLVAYVVARPGKVLETEALRLHLLGKVPEYMVPGRIMVIGALPLTPNGKVDRNRLPAPADEKRVGNDYAPPRNGIEALLADIWSHALRRERVGIHDNFFELGGDSILSVQIAARANEAGLDVSTRDVFEHQTIARLALAAGQNGTKAADEIPPGGPVELTPIQHLYFEVTDPDSVDVSVFHPQLLTVPEGVVPEIAERVIDHMLQQHDALRLRFEKRNGAWRQFSVPVEEHRCFARVDLCGVPAAEQSAVITREAIAAQYTLNLRTGPIVRTIWFELGDGREPRLLLLVHHMAVDGVSWRILLEDLQRGCHALLNGDALKPGRKATSFQQWSARLQTHALSPEVLREMDHWSAYATQVNASLPTDMPNGENLTESEAAVTVWLGEEKTRALLQDVPARYQTQINDALLTACLGAFEAWTGERAMLVDLEGHGREHLFENVDVSQTVGWFTTMYPVRLVDENDGDIGALLKSVKEQLRAIPNRGIGYGLLRHLNPSTSMKLASLPRPQICFNYWGQLDLVLDHSSGFRRAPESCGPTLNGRRYRTHLLDVGVAIVGGRLGVGIMYSQRIHRRSAIEQFAAAFLRSLEELVAHCPNGTAADFTPSDFPLAGLDQDELDRLAATLERRNVQA